MSKIHIELDDKIMKQLLFTYIEEQYGIKEPLENNNVTIMVKSKQNYRSEWEPADFKVVIEKHF